jgi:hypothetical protein
MQDFCKKVSAERLELSTNGLKGRCSAIELRAPTCEQEFYHDEKKTSKGNCQGDCI